MNPISRTGPLVVAALTASLVLVASASAATITPTPGFVADNHTDDANCSLREAVTIANADSSAAEPDCGVNGTLGNDTIALGAGTYVLDIAGVDGGNPNATGDLDANTTLADLTIDGAGAATTTIDSNLAAPTDRVLQHGSSGSLNVTDLTVTGGNSVQEGGGILSQAELALERVVVTFNTTGSVGGGISARGSSLTITDSVVSDNTNTGVDGGGLITDATVTTIDSSVIRGNSGAHSGGPNGGGIQAVDTTLTITDSLIVDNDVTDTDAAGTVRGGGLAIAGAAASATIRGTTISANRALGGSDRTGAGVLVTGTASAILINSTVSANEALGAGGDAAGMDADGGTVDLIHTTFGPNPVGPGGDSAIAVGTLGARGVVIETASGRPACGGGFNSLGGNVLTDTSCGPAGTNDELDADPLLGPLADNGGPDAGAPGFLEPIPTHLPAAASTVVDHVPAADCDDDLGASLLVDQRGVGRPFESDGDGIAECEAGSVESQAAPPPPPPPPPPTGGGQQPPAQKPAAKKCKKGQKLKKGKCVRKKRKKK